MNFVNAPYIYIPKHFRKGYFPIETKIHPADDWPRPYLRDGVGGLPIERQAEMLRAAGVDLGGEKMERAFVDRLTKNQIRKRERASLKQRDVLLAPSARRTTEMICLASLRVLGWNIFDIANCILLAAKRRARIRCVDTGTIYSVDMTGVELLQALVLSEEASMRTRVRMLSGGVTAAAEAKKRRNAPKLRHARGLWIRPSSEISAKEIAERVKLSVKTLYKALGPREDARDEAERGKKHA